MVMKFTNNATSTLAAGINSSVTTLSVAAGQGALFPTLSGDYFYCTLANVAGTVEIIKVTARSTDTFTIVRGQDNTTAATWIAGDKVELRLVAASLNDLPKLDEDNTFTGSNTIPLPVINNIKLGYTTTATAAGTTTLTSASNHYQRFTGSTTQTIVLPVTSTLTTGITYAIENTSTGNLTVNSSGGNLVVTVIPGVTVQCMCIGTSLTTAADWDPEYNEFASITGTGSAVLGTAPTVTNSLITTIRETSTISATAATGTINFDAVTQAVLYYTTNASGNFTVNFRGSGTVSLDTMMSTGQSLSATFLVTNGSTAYYNSAVQVDGSSVTPKWQGGTAPTSGNASSIDSYTYVVIKTGSAAFTVLASQTKFA
jgi:hypothetical protein